MNPLPRVKLCIGRWNGPRRNPQNGVEGIHRVETTVKPKYELVEVGLKMVRLDTAMMGAIDPCLQIGEDKVDHRQMLFRFFWVVTKRERSVAISHSSEEAISLPAISANQRACRYVVLDECCERIG